MEIKVVIGAQYGDEGKGRMVDYFTRDCDSNSEHGSNMAVVLTNGSAQRGHTVVKGRMSHVFHHFGSGTLNGAYTLITSEFLLHPMVFRKEWNELVSIGCNPVVFVSDKCRIVTPWDVLINQCWESVKGDVCFGSCGMGVYEAIKRSEIEKYNITLADVCECCWNKNWDGLIQKMNAIVMDYVPNRLHELLGEYQIPDKYVELLEKDYISSFIDDLMFFAGHTSNLIDAMPENFDRIVFENAQGLAISQRYYSKGEMTTPTYTGVQSSINALNELGLCYDVDNPTCNKVDNLDIEVCYVTRWYTTRHGGGKLPNETAFANLSRRIMDTTNVPNEWQGSIRYAKFNIDKFSERVRLDILDFYNFETKNFKISFAINHLDQIYSHIPFVSGYSEGSVDAYGFAGSLIDAVSGYVSVTSRKNEYNLYFGYDADAKYTRVTNVKEEC